MIISALSDTHNRHKSVHIPKCDVIIHAGDACGYGTLSETTHFLKWYAKQDADYKIFVPGNHDCLFEDDFYTAKSLCDQYGIILLLNNETVIHGIKFYGSPVTPYFCNWAFNKIGSDIKQYWDVIPDDTGILITHGPSRGTLDTVGPLQANYSINRLGCPYLKERMLQLKHLKYHIHGHIHDSYGMALFDNRVIVRNVAICNEDYVAINKVTKIVI